MSDKFSAVWVSHSSIRDFLNCPRSYFLKNIYRDPKTGHKIKVMSAPLALGQAVHEVLEALSVMPRDERFATPLVQRLEDLWPKFAGEQGGFLDKDTEHRYKTRGKEMLFRAQENPGPLKRLAIKMKEDLPHYWLSEEDQIILCGKLDWLEYLADTDSVHIIDFKTGKGAEDSESLQLPIYHLLSHNCQQRKVAGASYWYLERENEPTQQVLPPLEEAHEKILDIARKMKLARQLQKFDCVNPKNCHFCRPLEQVIAGKGKFIGLDQYKSDTYILDQKKTEEINTDSVIL
jgi:ATP-dependent helicase/DNAse subunit B